MPHVSEVVASVVGREAELAVLSAAGIDPRVPALVVSREPGIGDTTFVGGRLERAVRVLSARASCVVQTSARRAGLTFERVVEAVEG